MKKLLFLAVAICMMSVAAFAQKTDYSGTWALDVAKSKLDARSRIESVTMTVTQTDKDVKVATETKRTPMPEAQDGGPARRGGFGPADTSFVSTLDGKETTTEVEGRGGKMPVKLMAKMDAGKLNLSSSRTFSSPMGEVTATTKETWALSDGGKTLTIVRESTSPRGTDTTTMVFVKK
jgi:hypothetical protein